MQASIATRPACPDWPWLSEAPPRRLGPARRLRRRVKDALLRAVDRGWFGLTPLETHVVICGFPRSGSTLLLLMAETCVVGARSFGGQSDALVAARFALRNHRLIITKVPDDVFFVDEIREFYRDRRAKARFVLTTRDPRGILTSIYRAKGDHYYLTPEQWATYDEHFRYASRSDDAAIVRYEDLVCRPDEVQRRLTGFLGWRVHLPFDQFHTRASSRFDAEAMNGLRPLDRKTLDAWRGPEHRARIRSVLDEIPDLPGRLVEMGYEPDTAWVRDYDEAPEPGAVPTTETGPSR